MARLNGYDDYETGWERFEDKELTPEQEAAYKKKYDTYNHVQYAREQNEDKWRKGKMTNEEYMKSDAKFKNALNYILYPQRFKRGGESKMAKYKNPAIKGWDKDGKPIGDPDLIILMDQQQTLRENVYPSKKELQEIDKAVKKGPNKTLGENLYESTTKGGDKKMAETNPKSKRIGYKNPSKRASGFAKSLKKGSGAKLTPTQVSFRSGYLQAQKDSATAYKLKKGTITFKDLIEK